MKESLNELVDGLVNAGFFLEEAVEILESLMIQKTLLRRGGNQSLTAKDLGIHRNTLQRKMVQYKLDGKRPAPKPPASANGKRPRAARKTS